MSKITNDSLTRSGSGTGCFTPHVVHRVISLQSQQQINDDLS